MKTTLRRAAGLLFAGLLALTSCRSSQPAAPPPVDAPTVDALTDDEICMRKCELAAQVACADQTDCLPACEQNEPTFCLAENRAFILCILANGTAAITCNVAGQRVPNPAYCVEESATLRACAHDAETAGGG